MPMSDPDIGAAKAAYSPRTEHALWLIVDDMEDVVGRAEGEGVNMDELSDFDIPESYRQRVQFAMDLWENGHCDLQRAHEAMKAIADEIGPKEKA